MKITEIFDVQNSDNNLILGQNTYILIHDYEEYKNRLHNHSTTLELLTQKALNLSLFKAFPQKLKIAKPFYHTKNERLKQVQKTKIPGVSNGELMVIKKLLMVNLRSFKIMQKLFQENKELQILLDDSRECAKKQKKKIEYVQNENESLKKTETRLKKRLESFFRQLNRASKSFIAGFKDDHHDNCDNEVFLKNDKNDQQRNSQKLELAFNLSTNVAYRLYDDANNFMKINNVYQEVSFNYDIALQDLKIFLIPGIIKLPSNIFFNSFDRQTKYPLLTWQTKKSFETRDRKSDSKEANSKCNYKIEKDIQNAIRLHSVNSSVWKSFLLMKTIQEFVIFHQVCELIKAFMIAGEACESDETCSETNQTTFFQLASLNPHSFVSESTNSKCISRSSLASNDITIETPSKKTKKYTRKHFRKIKVLHSWKKMHKKLINSASNNKKPSTKNLEKQACSIKVESISIGVGDSFIVSVDQESQVENDIFIKLAPETGYNESNVNLENDELNKKDSSTKTLSNSRKDFRKSLKSLEEIIKTCQLKSDQERTTTLRDKSRKNQFESGRKNVDTQRKVNTKVKEVKKNKRNPFDSYNKENRKVSKLPEMRKLYQIILENRLSQGVSFEYSTPDKSKVQLLFVSKSQSRML